MAVTHTESMAALPTKKGYIVAVAIIALVVLALRLMVSFQVAEPSYDSYFTLIQADTIKEDGLPRHHDPYSYQGRTYAFDPAYYYVMALATTFIPETLAVKILPNVFMALLVPLIYLLGYSLTKNQHTSLLAAIFGGLSPALFTTGINDAIPLTLALPMLAATILALLNLNKYPITVIVLTALLTLLSPLVWLLLIAELAYLLILVGERLKITVEYLEIALVTLLLAGWYTLITYKEALFTHGFLILSQSLPASVRAATFEQFTLLAMLYAVGVVPLALGSLALYHTTFEQRNRKVLFVASIGLVTLLGALLQLLPLDLALVLLSLIFAILAAPGLQGMLASMKQTHFNYLKLPLLAILLLFFLLTSLLPALVAGLYPGSSPTPNELAALDWIATHTEEDSVLIASPTAGFLINHKTRRAYLADEAYLLITNPDEILADMDDAYTTPRTVAAITLMDKYGISHVLLGPAENARYDDLGAIVQDEKCFPRLHTNPQVLVLGVNCTLTQG